VSKFVDAIFLKIGKKMNHPSNENLSIKQPKIEKKKYFLFFLIEMVLDDYLLFKNGKKRKK